MVIVVLDLVADNFIEELLFLVGVFMSATEKVGIPVSSELFL